MEAPVRAVQEDPATGRTVVHVAGDLDVATVPSLRAGLLALVDGGARDVVIDLTATTFLDSAALGVLIQTLKRLRTVGGTLRLAAPQPSVDRVLAMTALDRVFFTYPSVPAALADPLRYVPSAG